MADIDRYLAACEDRDADRRLSDEDLDRQARREGAYVKMLNCRDYQRMMGGLPQYDPAVVRAERKAGVTCACCVSKDVRMFSGTLLCESCCDEVTAVCSECGGLDFTSPDDGPTMCDDCRSCETDVAVDWCDGVRVGDDDDRESRPDDLMSAAEARLDEDRDREMEDR